jgi:hypothetical protein
MKLPKHISQKSCKTTEYKDLQDISHHPIFCLQHKVLETGFSLSSHGANRKSCSLSPDSSNNTDRF